MRIVHVANFYGPVSGGLRTTMHALGRGYAEAGHEFVMVVPGRRPTDEPTPYGRRVTLPGWPLPHSGGYRVLLDTDRVTSLLDGLAPDRLEVSDRLTLRGLGPWARTHAVPSVWFVHERLDGVLRAFAPGVPRTLPSVVDAHNRGTAERFDRIVCTTAYAAEELARVGAPHVSRVPLGVDLGLFTPRRRDPALRRRLARDDEHLVVLCSRLSREKRPELAVDAVALLRARGVRVRLVVAGSGPRRASLKRRARGLPVTFLGFLPGRGSVASLLATADTVVAPGPIETFGLAALEALASGTPVVASRTSALREIVTGDAGATTDVDAGALADAVADVLDRDATTRRRAARARAEEFPWGRTVASMLALHAHATSG